MIAQDKSASTLREKVVHCATEWRKTEKQAIGATPEQKPEAQRTHHRAKMLLREAVDMFMGKQP